MHSASSFEISLSSASTAFGQATPLYIRHDIKHVSLNQKKKNIAKELKLIDGLVFSADTFPSLRYKKISLFGNTLLQNDKQGVREIKGFKVLKV